MAASRKRNTSKQKKISFKFSSFTKRKRQRTSWFGPSLITMLRVLAVGCVISGIVIGLVYLERYVKETIPLDDVYLELAGVPVWTSDELKQKIRTAAMAKTGNGFSEDIVPSLQHDLEQHIPWLDDVKVRFIHDRIRVEGRWRKPIGLLKFGRLKFYVDSERVVLDYMPLPELPIVEIKGLPSITKIPPLGEVWQRDDLAAAVTILDWLDQMDKTLTPDKPLLFEIDRIDVSNFNGLQNSRYPHIILYSKDDAQIIWGAEFGKWQQHLESTDQEKFAKLYGYYKDYGTLSGGARYINLCNPHDKISLPIDRY